jgi:hypothetical protein
MLSIFGVSLVLYFIKILSGSKNFWFTLRTTEACMVTCISREKLGRIVIGWTIIMQN